MDLEDLIEFQKRSWRMQRVGWAFFTLVLLFAALGLFGDGWLSKTKAGQENGAIWVEYPRFIRFEDEILVTVHANAGVANKGETRLQVDWNYLQGMEVLAIFPQPDAQILDKDQVIFVFKTDDPGPTFTANFYLSPQTFGVWSGTVGVPGGQAVRFSQFIYP